MSTQLVSFGKSPDRRPVESMLYAGIHGLGFQLGFQIRRRLFGYRAVRLVGSHRLNLHATDARFDRRFELREQKPGHDQRQGSGDTASGCVLAHSLTRP